LILTIGKISIVYDAAKVCMIQLFHTNSMKYSYDFKKPLISTSFP